MRIAVVSGNQEVVGGAEAYLRWLLQALVERGHEICVAFEHDAVRAERALDRESPPMARCSLSELGLARWKQQLLAFQPDVAYIHGISQPALEQWLLEHFSTVFYAHAFHGSCATGTRRHTFPTISACQRKFGPACLGVNYLRGCGMRRPDHLLRMFAEQRARERLLPRYDAVVVASRHVRDVYVRHGIAPGRLHVLPIPTLEWHAPEQPPSPRPSSGRVLFAGRATMLKGLEHAVRAVALAQRWLSGEMRLTIAGEGPDLARCLELAKQLSVNAVAAGWVEGRAKRKVFDEADVLLVPSLWPEPFGVVGIEAGALGVPAVGYSIGGIPDWLVTGVSGELAETLDPSALGLALVRALRDAEHHAALGQGAWQMARRHSPERHLVELERLFQSLSAVAQPALAATL